MATGTRGLSIDDLFDFRWLQGGTLSPDGRRLAYAVTHVARGTESDGNENERDREYSTIYVYDLDDATNRQMTPGTSKDTNPAWSPDGTTIAFLSDRAGGAEGSGTAEGEKQKAQIYLLPVDGGEARKLTSLKQGAGAPRWSPDGSRIAFSAGIEWGEGEKPDRSKDPYRVTRNVWRFDGIGDLDMAVSNLHVTEAETGETRRISDHDGTVDSIEWSRDGSHIFYSVSMLPNRWAGFHSTHYIVRPDGAVVHRIDNLRTLREGTWLPDGKRLAFIGPESEEEPIGKHPDLFVYDLESGGADNRTEGMELDLNGSLSAKMPAHGQRDGGILVTEDGRSAYVQVQRSGRVEICRFSLEGENSCQTVVTGDRAAYLYDSAAGGPYHVILYASADIVNPPDLCVARISDGAAEPVAAGSDAERRLTRMNEELLEQIALPNYRELHFTGTDGEPVHGWFVSPAADPPHPTILWIHGGPHGAQGYQFAVDTLLLTGAGYGVLYVNHRASTGYGDAFSTAIEGDWGNLDYGDLMSGVDFAISEGLADPDRLGCCGISGGGNLSCWIVSHTDRFKAAVPQNPVTSWRSFYGVSDIGVWFSRKQLGGDPHEIPEVYDRCSPITTAHTCTTPTLLIQCESDFRCPAGQSEQFYTVLRANGCIVEMLRQPQGSHGGSIRGPLPLRKANLEAKLAWFQKYVPVSDGLQG